MKIKGKNIALGILALAFVASLSVGVGTTVAADRPQGALVTAAPSQTETPVDENRAYYVGKDDSSLEYVEYGYDSIYPTLTGLEAALVPGDVLTLKNVVDLEEMEEKDQAFVTIFPITHTKGSAEYTKVEIEIIDVYDPTNYLKVRISGNPLMEDTSDVSYFLAGASNGQKLTGYETGSDKLHVNNEYGQYSVFNFSGLLGNSSGTGLFYSVSQNAMYTVNYAGAKSFIIDFDDPAYFGTYIWDGFTSNEVYCRIRLDGHKKETATVLVSQYGEYDMANPALCDEKAPALSVDFGEYATETVPNALKNEPYRIFPYSAFDAVDGETEVDVKVYTNYYSTNKKEVTIKNGKFTPRMQVPHHIVYSATDKHGNVAEKIVEIKVVASCDPLAITFGAEIPQTYVQGEQYEIPAYTTTGGIGNVAVDVSATLNGEPIEIQNGAIRPNKVGTLVVTYVLQDYVEQTETITHEIEITAAEKPTFIETPLLPKYLITGNCYTLPKIYAYNYVTGVGEAIETTVTVIENGEEMAVNGNVYVPGNVSSAEIVYTAKVGDAVNTYRKTLPVYAVMDGDRLDVSKYFLCGENGVAKAKTRAVDLTAMADEEFAFLNHVTSVYFRSDLTLTDESFNAKKVHVYLTDITDDAKQIKFTYTLTGSAATFYVNDNASAAMSVSGTLKKGTRLSLAFEAEQNVVYYDVANDNILQVQTYLNGEPFEGFAKNRVYVTYAIEGVKADTSATLSVTSLNDTYFNNGPADYMEPLIDVIGSIGGEYEINSVVTLPEIIANDVLSGEVDAYITLTSPSGVVMSSTSGVRIENLLYNLTELQVKLPEYGRYTLEVSAKDNFDNETMLPLVFWVIDTQDPTLEILGTLPTNAKVGDNVSVPNAKATDNVAKELIVHRYVFSPSGIVTELQDNETGFRATDAGTYVVVYMVSDGEGNFVSEYHKITVAEV